MIRYLLSLSDLTLLFFKQVKIKFKVPDDVKLHGALHHPNQSTENSNNQISMTQDGNFVTFDLDLLLKGKQCFALYASVSCNVTGCFCIVPYHDWSMSKWQIRPPQRESKTQQKCVLGFMRREMFKHGYKGFIHVSLYYHG